MTRVDSVPLKSGEYCDTAMRDPAGEYAYFAGSSNRIVKVRLGALERIGVLRMPSDENNFASGAVDPRGEYAYFGTDTTYYIYTGSPRPAKVAKIRLSDFTRVGALSLDAREYFAAPIVFDPRGEYAYLSAGDSGAPGATKKIVKIRLSDFTRVSSLSLDANEGSVFAGAFDPRGDYAYFPFLTYFRYGRSAPTVGVAKIRLSDFTRLPSAIRVESNVNGARGIFIDSAGEYAYISLATFGSGKFVKARLSDVSEVESLALDKAIFYSVTLADPRGEFAYLASEKDLIKVRLRSRNNAG